jgi:DNA-binding NarL/FixJ family response regulator
MHIRYVQDTKADGIAVRKIFEHDKDVQISCCARNEEFCAAPANLPIDVLLIEMRRRGAASPEEDVKRARQCTTAPIVILTGADTPEIHERAMRAGADAVMSKEAVSAELICKVAEDARSRARPAASASKEKSLFDLPAPRNPVLAQLDAPLAFLEQELERLLHGGEGDDRRAAAPMTLLAIARYARQLGAREVRRSVECDAADILAAMREGLFEAAAELGAPLLLDVKAPAKFLLVGSALDAKLGLEAIVLGLLYRCAPGGRLRVTVECDGDETRLRAKGDLPLIADPAAFFPDASAVSADFGAAALQSGAALLGLRREQCVVLDRGESVEIVL